MTNTQRQLLTTGLRHAVGTMLWGRIRQWDESACEDIPQPAAPAGEEATSRRRTRRTRPLVAHLA